MAALAAELDWADGRWDDATRAAEQAIADHGCRRAPAMARWALGWVAFGRGETDLARETLEPSLAFGDASEMIEWRLPPRWGLAETACRRRPGDGDRPRPAALELARASGERATFAPFVVTGVRAFQAAGRPSDAERWLAAGTEHLAPTPAFAKPALEHGQGLVSLVAVSTGSPHLPRGGGRGLGSGAAASGRPPGRDSTSRPRSPARTGSPPPSDWPARSARPPRTCRARCCWHGPGTYPFGGVAGSLMTSRGDR